MDTQAQVNFYASELQFWDAEADYIESVRPSAPGASFNGDTECFRRYCLMQYSRAIKDQNLNAAERILTHITK